MKKISPKIRQKLKIIPNQILQSNILELSNQEIESIFKEELEKNPVLEEIPIFNNFTKENYDSLFQNQDEYDSFFSNIAQEDEVEDFLIKQINESILSESKKDIAKEILFNLDHKGFLDIEIELLADNLNVSKATVESVRNFIKENLNPRGLGCLDLQEYLLFQIGDENYLSVEIICNHYEDFLKQNFKHIKAQTNSTSESFAEAIELIKSQELQPLKDSILNHEIIIPDILIQLNQDQQWVVVENDKIMQKYKISSEYLNAATLNKLSKNEFSFVSKNIDKAKLIFDSIQYRFFILKIITEQILILQDLYLKGVQKHPSPMKLEDIALNLEIDISTVSRAIKNKYLESPIGIISFKDLFGIGIIKNGEKVSIEVLKDELIYIINNEDKTNPYNDSQLKEKLDKKGYDISRRTIVKYRQLLNIKTANERKYEIKTLH
jgi:RNA polymerase sigma-54 factor